MSAKPHKYLFTYNFSTDDGKTGHGECYVTFDTPGVTEERITWLKNELRANDGIKAIIVNIIKLDE